MCKFGGVCVRYLLYVFTLIHCTGSVIQTTLSNIALLKLAHYAIAAVLNPCGTRTLEPMGRHWIFHRTGRAAVLPEQLGPEVM